MGIVIVKGVKIRGAVTEKVGRQRRSGILRNSSGGDGEGAATKSLYVNQLQLDSGRSLGH